MSWFEGKNDDDLERLAGIIWDLRRELYMRTVYRPAHEREWESDEAECRREKDNEESLMKFDLETRRLILGTTEEAK
jgi:hypothetical protein